MLEWSHMLHHRCSGHVLKHICRAAFGNNAEYERLCTNLRKACAPLTQLAEITLRSVSEVLDHVNVHV